jgi:hypothetical protein
MNDHDGIFEQLELAALMTFHIENIKKAEDIDSVNTHISCMHDVLKNGPYAQTMDELKNSIKTGVGGYSEIQEKCVRLGVV